MKFLPAIPEASVKTKKNSFYWESQTGLAGKRFHLYETSTPVASLRLSEGSSKPAYFKMGNQTIEFQDNSTFFTASLQLVDQIDQQSIGYIQKSAQRPEEGAVSIFGEAYGWKMRTLHENSLLLMDQQHRRLITYHYSHSFVRLLLTKHVWNNHQVVPLLCIGLYLLPIWHD